MHSPAWPQIHNGHELSTQQSGLWWGYQVGHLDLSVQLQPYPASILHCSVVQSGEAVPVGFGGALLFVLLELLLVLVKVMVGVTDVLLVDDGASVGKEHVPKRASGLSSNPSVGTQTLTSVEKPF